MRINWCRKRELGFALLVLGALAISACHPVGPDYAKPKIPPPPKWNAGMSEGLRATEASDATLARWWTTLRDPTLNRLIDRAIDGNLDLRRATAVVREARARRGIANADRFPTITASGLAAGQRGSDRMGRAANVGLFTAGFDAGWEVDVFGRVRRSIEAANASLQATGELLRDTLVSLLGEVAVNYVEVRQLQTRLAIAEDNLKLQEDTYKLAVSRFQAGLTTRLDVDQAGYNVADTRSRIPALRSQLTQAKNRLDVLVGENPGRLSELLRKPGPIPVGPPEVAVGVPADMLRRRPDIRRAERILAARTAAVGIAVAAKYPRFSLSGALGYGTLTKGQPLSLGNIVASLGGSALFTVLDGGRIRQNIEVQDAVAEQALIDYESSILLALEEVENALTAYAQEQVRRRSLLDAAAAAGRAVNLVRSRYAAGLVDFQRVLDSERALLSFQDQVAVSDGAVTTDLIRLYKALGGGWGRTPPSAPPKTSQLRK